ncbi:glycoside hydrolase family 78 protein [Aliifodinibius sp. S!AR15-10]|uniref:family 78 glycoside hydrolase catalytic domain n=1 Tax=Aliifodinibius sp. S!AR15-10 TaxID=2950437 RepID=UPI00285F263A|nr:family 78 glycoside hydrolase catalytic domain [Aliifodinibius sp. S!AR15-10]MDR8391957.1 glycoside hydrolase family 78 protein [Aliifodinibius sp. S!AR15-10]
MEELSFSWQLSSSLRNQYQSAWQIVLASSEEALENEEYIWNSGKQQGRQNTRISYNGPELDPATSYYWKVRVWDENGNSTDWSNPGRFVTALFEPADWQGAKWIGYEILPESLEVVPGVHGPGDELGEKGTRRPAVPRFRKEFNVDKPVKEAYLFITGLGHYEADLNGQKVGDRFLSPGWTDYQETVFYNTYDITDQLNEGANAIGVTVGNGFYNINRERYRKLVIAHGMPKMLSLLRVVYEDGTVQNVTSGPDWETTESPITYTSIYGGENYDARQEQPGWNSTNFTTGTDWKPALEVEAPAGELKAQINHPVKVMDTLEVKRILEPEPGTYVYDFGQNASGIMKLEVNGAKGQEVILRPAELLTEEGFANQDATGEPHYYRYTLNGDGTETWQPKFTYYGFRYVQVEGAAPGTADQGELPKITDLDFLHTRSSAPQTGHFETSFGLFNEINELIKWAIRSNIQSVMTDCPHREKLGWMEQTHLMGGSVHYNYHLYHLYKKLVHDMMDSQTESGLVPSIAPEYVVFNWGVGFRDSPEWGSASVILPWLIYKWYGDVQVMEEAWPMMTKYVDYLESTSENHIVSHGLGDWYDLGPEAPGLAQLTPKALTATAIYYYDITLLSKMAEILGKTEEAESYRTQAREIYEAFNDKFYNQETGIYATGSQTSMAMPLVVGLVDSLERQQVLSNLTDSIRANNKALTAGDVGFNYLVKALEQGGASQLLYEMNTRDDVPGYGYQLKKGATALTESWAALERVSNNHLMLGHIMEWFYGGLAGIQQAEGSHAYSHILIDPDMVGDIEWTQAWYESPNGRIESDWSLDGENGTLDVKIPVNSIATVVIPSAEVDQISESGEPVSNHSEIMNIATQDSTTNIEIGSGDWSFDFPKR